MIQTKRAAITIKASSLTEDGSFEGYGSVFNALDTGGDITIPGSFAASLKARRQSGDWPRLLLEHDPARPIGVWTDIAEDSYGLHCKGRLILDVQDAREVYALMKAGHSYGLSIGYETLAERWCQASDIAPGLPKSQARALDELNLWEVSVVTFPMLLEARVEAVKSIGTTDYSPIFAALARREQALSRAH